MKWNYKIDLKDESVFSEIEKDREIKIPDDLKEMIKEGNAATPEKYKFMTGSTEHALGAVLSFNKNEQGTDTVFTALQTIRDKNLLPFAIDPFGNYICLDLKKNIVVFWDHEFDQNNIYSTEMNLKNFFEKLY